MNTCIKLIWDFRGKDAQGTAEHHRRHLAGYAATQKEPVIETGTESLSDMHWIVFLIVEEKDMISFRDVLRPHRGERMSES